MWTWIGIGLFVTLAVARWLIFRAPVNPHHPDPDSVRLALSQLASDEAIAKSLSVEYTDLHGFHGGLTLRICGDGRIFQQAVRTRVSPPKERVSVPDLRRLVSLLQEISAWQQLVPFAMPVPDESRALLRIEIAGHYSLIWERYNDLEAGQRIVRVRELLKEIAWQPSTQ